MGTPDLAARPAARRGVARFGVFELNVATGELRKQGIRLRLQGKPLALLVALLERPGALVTRQELRARLWTDDVFVDVDAGLNTAANRLRIALSDSATSPRFIETLARHGYRFIGPVEWRDSDAPAQRDDTDPPIDAPPPASLTVRNPDDATRRPVRSRRYALAAAAVGLTLAVVGLASTAVRSRDVPSALDFRPLTFSRGVVWGARFAPGGRDVIYAANWEDGPRALYSVTPREPESRILSATSDRLVAVARTGELALLGSDGALPIAGGDLLRGRSGAAAQDLVARNVMAADWMPDGSTMAVARAVEGTNVLEFPVGVERHRTSGWIGGLRVAPEGGRVAFTEHPVRHDNAGDIRLLDDSGVVSTLSSGWANIGGLAWHPNGEVWFTAARDGSPKALWAIRPSGELRTVAKPSSALTLRDISADGAVLASTDTTRLEMAVLRGEGPQRNITLFDWSRVVAISPDGTTVLFDESGAAGGSEYLIYLHDLRTGRATRVGEGRAMALSKDGRSVLALGSTQRSRLRSLPIGGGQVHELQDVGLEYQWAQYFPDGRTILTLANLPGQALRLYVQPADGPAYALTPPTMVRNAAIAPDGARIALLSSSNALVIYPTTPNGSPTTVPGGQNLAPLLWTTNDWLYVQRLGAYTQIPTEILRLHVPTGRLEPWRAVSPDDVVGVNAITKVMVAADERTVVFNYRRLLSELLISGRPSP